MSTWEIDESTSEDLGFFRIYVTPPNGRRTDVTFFRGVPTQLMDYSVGDPYGDATASINFPQVSILDELGSGDLSWFREFADVDIVLEDMEGNQKVLWEGFFASYDWAHNEGSSVLNVTCQGALFQVDRYVSSPSYPSVPIAYEQLIAESFDPARHPHLRTQPLKIEWPDNWSVLAYVTTGAVGLQTGGKSTGFATRTTGAWDKALTGMVSNLLSVMYTTDYADQWTIRKDAGRQPVMCVRFASRPADFSLDAGMPGLGVQLSRDFTQYANVLYGSGTTKDGSEWSRQSVSRDNARTDYLPMAADPRVDNPANAAYSTDVMRAETHVKFDDGMEVSQALRSSQLMLRRNQDPGYAGTLTLNIDPVELSRYEVRAGMTVRLRYFGGTGDEGLKLHITQSSVSLADGTLSLTVDSKYRDALTVEETLARTRDPLTPIKMLQVGKASFLIPDQMAPWSYALGSGYAPKAGQAFFDTLRGPTESFPYTESLKAYPPRTNGSFYVPINAAHRKPDGRWAGPIPIRMAEKGDIRLTQFALVDRDGNLVKIPFHVSIYDVPVGVTDMPFNDHGHSPFIPGAFQTKNEFGQDIPADSNGNNLYPQQSLLIGWGDSDQPAGYSPGIKSAGDPATGLLIDETSWSFDNTKNPDFQLNPKAGYVQKESAITVYAMFYAEYHDWVYAIGRLYRKEPGT